MMDIALRYDPDTKYFDIPLDGGDLATDDGLESAVLLSLFTDRLAQPDDRLPDGSSNRRGYWTDGYYPFQHGSRLWLIRREKMTPELLHRAREYAEESLQWLIDEDVVDSVTVEVSAPRRDMLGLRVIVPRDGVSSFDRLYEYPRVGTAQGVTNGV